MRQDKEKVQVVKLEVKGFRNEEDAQKDASPIEREVFEFKYDRLRTLNEIDPNPAKAIILALQIALKLKRFDEKSPGIYFITSKNNKGKFVVPEWEYGQEKWRMS